MLQGGQHRGDPAMTCACVSGQVQKPQPNLSPTCAATPGAEVGSMGAGGHGEASQHGETSACMSILCCAHVCLHYSYKELCLTVCYKGLLACVWEGMVLQLSIKTAIKAQYV